MNLLNGFLTVALIIGVGVLLAHLGVVSLTTQRELGNFAFLVASPALMLTTISETDVGSTLWTSLVASAASFVVAAGSYCTYARWRRRRGVGDLVVGGLAAGYVNAGNLGIPVAGYVLGNAAAVAPTLLLQLLVLQPLALLALESTVPGRARHVSTVLTRPLRTPITVGSMLGLLLAVTGWTLPPAVHDPIELLGNMAIPAMLVSYGIALRLGPGLAPSGERDELAVTTVAKLVVQPLAAYAVAHWLLGVDGAALVAIVVTAALPTAQNVFLHATRYGRAEVLTRDTILITTLLSLPVVVLVVVMLG
jgi:malonate transporter